MTQNWKEALTTAERDAKGRFESIELVGNEAHAEVAIASLRAFGNDPTAMIFAEPRTPDHATEENARPTDILVLHRELGAFMLEVKGWVISEIVRIEAGTFFRQVKGSVKAHNPWKQAQDASGQLKDATSNVVRARGLSARDVPYFDWVVALPNISRKDWTSRGYNNSINSDELLLAEDLSDPVVLRSKLTDYIARKARNRLPFSADQLDHVREALGSSVVINRRRNRSVIGVSERLGAKIDSLEVTGKRLSQEQMDIIQADFEGRPQLIRGVAGSGKSIVLIKNLVNLVDRTFNAAQLSLIPPPSKRFLVVCFNRSLVPFLREHFESSYKELTHRESPPSVDVMHVNKLPYAHSKKNGGPLEYQPFRPNKNREIALNYCAQLDNLREATPRALEAIQYDAIYVDEGQDLFEEEFVLLLKFLKTDPKTGLKNIVIFYDDAQNLYGRPRPTWNKLGIDITGRTRVMKKCFRNTKQTVEFAFNLLLGVKAETRVKTKSFADVETLKDNDLVRELPDRWEVYFAEHQGPAPEVKLFRSREQEKDWVKAAVQRLINEDGVRPGDILLISEGVKDFESVADSLLACCKAIQRVIKPYGESSNPDKDRYIFEAECLTLATVEAAKGYDSPIVFLMGADLFGETVESRARFYVGSTRAKMRLFVTGIQGQGFADEAEAVSKLLATAAPEVRTSPSVTRDHTKVPDSPAPSKTPIPARAAGIQASLHAAISSTPGPLTSSTLVPQAFTPRFRRGAAVQHPRHGAGRVVRDGVRKYLSSQERWDEDVRVQFGGTIMKLEAGTEGLVLLQ